MTTQDWLTLAVAIAGIAGTLAATVLAQRDANKRDDERWRRERLAERDRWNREDELRNFEHMRDAYTVFLNQWRRYFDLILCGRKRR